MVHPVLHRCPFGWSPSPELSPAPPHPPGRASRGLYSSLPPANTQEGYRSFLWKPSVLQDVRPAEKRKTTFTTSPPQHAACPAAPGTCRVPRWGQLSSTPGPRVGQGRAATTGLGTEVPPEPHRSGSVPGVSRNGGRGRPVRPSCVWSLSPALLRRTLWDLHFLQVDHCCTWASRIGPKAHTHVQGGTFPRGSGWSGKTDMR